MVSQPLLEAIERDGRKKEIIGALANITSFCFSRILTGDRDPRLSEMLSIAQVLGVRASDLFPILNSIPMAANNTRGAHAGGTRVGHADMHGA